MKYLTQTLARAIAQLILLPDLHATHQQHGTSPSVTVSAMSTQHAPTTTSSTIIPMFADASASSHRTLALELKCLTRVTAHASAQQALLNISSVEHSLSGISKLVNASATKQVDLTQIVASDPLTTTHASAIAKS